MLVKCINKTIVMPTLGWIAFEATNGNIHSCPNRPLNIKTKMLIQEAVNKMNNTATTHVFYRNIDITSSQRSDDSVFLPPAKYARLNPNSVPF